MWNIEPTDENIAVWQEELAIYTVGDLRRAYKALVDAGGKSPPALPEIKALCRGTIADAQARSGTPIDQTAIDGPKVPEKQAAANRDRLRRIMAGMELDIEKHCITGHLSNPMKRRFEESINGYPTYNGYAVDPKYISKKEDRERYVKEIEEWSEARG